MTTTTKITRIDRATARTLGDEITAALAPLAARYGVTIGVKGGSFTAANLTLKVEIATVGDDGEAVTAEATAFRQRALFHGLTPDDLGRTFQHRGQTHKIVGWKPAARTSPVLTESGGKRYKWAPETVAALLKAGG